MIIDKLLEKMQQKSDDYDAVHEDLFFAVPKLIASNIPALFWNHYDGEAYTEAALQLIPDEWRMYSVDSSIEERFSVTFIGPKYHYDSTKLLISDYVSAVAPTFPLALLQIAVKIADNRTYRHGPQ